MQNRIVILMSCVSQLKSEGIFKPHYHPYYQLNHILKGEFTYVVDGETFVARPGDTVLIPYNSVHSLMLTQREDGYYYEVKFTTLSKTDKALCHDAGVFKEKDEFTGMLFSAILEENENLTPFSEEIMVNYLYSILYKLSVDSRRKKNAPSKYIEVTAYSEPVRKTIRFLEDHYTRQLSLGDIVAHADVKKSCLSRRFKEETSLTIFECLMVIRVRKAVELLTFTGMSLAEISRETGFVNLTHFNRVFTKHVMIPPGHYRRHLMMQGEYLSNASADPQLSPIAGAALSGKKIDFAEMMNQSK